MKICLPIGRGWPRLEATLWLELALVGRGRVNWPKPLGGWFPHSSRPCTGMLLTDM